MNKVFKVQQVLKVFKVKEGQWYFSVEGASGEFGVYLDSKGDYKIEPVTIPSAPAYLSRTYNYEPVPDTIKSLGLEKLFLGGFNGQHYG